MTSGWGAVNQTGPFEVSDQLVAVSVPIVADRKCRRLLSSNFNRRSDVCAATLPGGGHGHCFGDSGGPLVVPVEVGTEAAWRLAGVVSAGGTESDCAPPGPARSLRARGWQADAVGDRRAHAADRRQRRRLRRSAASAAADEDQAPSTAEVAQRDGQVQVCRRRAGDLRLQGGQQSLGAVRSHVQEAIRQRPSSDQGQGHGLARSGRPKRRPISLAGEAALSAPPGSGRSPCRRRDSEAVARSSSSWVAYSRPRSRSPLQLARLERSRFSRSRAEGWPGPPCWNPSRRRFRRSAFRT